MTLRWRWPEMSTSANAWIAHNQHFLSGAIADVRACLERVIDQRESEVPKTVKKTEFPLESIDSENRDPVPALEVLVRSFGLSSFERAILVLCAGIELDSSLGGLCAAAQQSQARM